MDFHCSPKTFIYEVKFYDIFLRVILTNKSSGAGDGFCTKIQMNMEDSFSWRGWIYYMVNSKMAYDVFQNLSFIGQWFGNCEESFKFHFLKNLTLILSYKVSVMAFV